MESALYVKKMRHIYCDDQDCQMDALCQGPTTEVNCVDGVDNDGFS